MKLQPENTTTPLMEKLLLHANRAVNFDDSVLKRRVAVKNPNGGFRMEVQIINRKKT